MRGLFRNFIIFFLIFLGVAGLFSMFSTSLNRAESITLNDLAAQVDAGAVKAIEVSGDRVAVEFTDGGRALAQKEPTESLGALLTNFGVEPTKLRTVAITVQEQSTFAALVIGLLPFLISIVLIGGFLWFMLRQVQGQNNRALMFGQSRVRETTPKSAKRRVTFADVAGVPEAKEELQEVVEFLSQPKKFLSLGAKIPKGVLLLGAPGTGKTLLARAVAGEANVPFFHLSGSEFVEMFVGVGASRVRDLFRRAKRAAPCIVFIDEIDAVGRQRGAGLGGSHDEREQTLNQILVEMDGFDTDTNVIVMAATNRPDVLDPALLRPGRFDRRVIIDLPDLHDREAILKIHAREKPLAADVNMRTLAERTPGFSGADLANLLNEAAILAARRNKKKIELTECLESIEKVMLGPERKSHVLSTDEKKVTAYHEAGHALVAHTLPHADPVRKVSITARGMAAGYTLKLPSREKYLQSRADFLDELAVFLGGYAAEQVVFNDITTGATNDLREATKLARRLITEYGMSETLGPRSFGQREELVFLGREIHERRDYSEKVAEAIDREVSKLLADAQRTATAVIRRLRSKLDRIATLLIKQETIEQSEFEALFKLAPKGARI